MRKLSALLLVTACNTAPAATDAPPAAVTATPVAVSAPAEPVCSPDDQTRMVQIQLRKTELAAGMKAKGELHEKGVIKEKSDKADLVSELDQAIGEMKALNSERDRLYARGCKLVE